eukprot:403343210
MLNQNLKRSLSSNSDNSYDGSEYDSEYSQDFTDQQSSHGASQYKNSFDKIIKNDCPDCAQDFLLYNEIIQKFTPKQRELYKHKLEDPATESSFKCEYCINRDKNEKYGSSMISDQQFTISQNRPSQEENYEENDEDSICLDYEFDSNDELLDASGMPTLPNYQEEQDLQTLSTCLTAQSSQLSDKQLNVNSEGHKLYNGIENSQSNFHSKQNFIMKVEQQLIIQEFEEAKSMSAISYLRWQVKQLQNSRLSSIENEQVDIQAIKQLVSESQVRSYIFSTESAVEERFQAQINQKKQNFKIQESDFISCKETIQKLLQESSLNIKAQLEYILYYINMINQNTFNKSTKILSLANQPDDGHPSFKQQCQIDTLINTFIYEQLCKYLSTIDILQSLKVQRGLSLDTRSMSIINFCIQQKSIYQAILNKNSNNSQFYQETYQLAKFISKHLQASNGTQGGFKFSQAFLENYKLLHETLSQGAKDQNICEGTLISSQEALLGYQDKRIFEVISTFLKEQHLMNVVSIVDYGQMHIYPKQDNIQDSLIEQLISYASKDAHLCQSLIFYFKNDNDRLQTSSDTFSQSITNLTNQLKGAIEPYDTVNCNSYFTLELLSNSTLFSQHLEQELSSSQQEESTDSYHLF